MIEVIAEGPVYVEQDERIDRQSGHDRIAGRVTTTQEREVKVDLEFPQGYVNLEGYAPSQVSWPIEEIFGRYIEFETNHVRIETREWDVSIEGEWFDWIQQAHRYQTERPDRSIVGCLQYFGVWDETSARTLKTAVQNAREYAGELADREMGQMDDDVYAELRRSLNEAEHVQIPESYTEEQHA